MDAASELRLLRSVKTRQTGGSKYTTIHRLKMVNKELPYLVPADLRMYLDCLMLRHLASLYGPE